MSTRPMKILIIQTAFIGDVILATSLIDYTKRIYPNAEVHFLLRKGNESITNTHKNIAKTWIWDKQGGKFKNLLKLIWKVRNEKFDLVLNIQRFFNSGLITALSGAKVTVGFKKNPMSFFFRYKVKHLIPHVEDGLVLHEVQRNALLLNTVAKINKIPDLLELRPSLYPKAEEIQKINAFTEGEYLVLAPASVWFTKQWAQEKWIELVKRLSHQYKIYLIGAPSDINFIDQIIEDNPNCLNLAGKLNLRESAYLMKNAIRVFVNDSAPLHLASAVNANVTAIFCSTIPEFGYTPISDNYKVLSLNPRLECMPCGLHGKKVCPLGHFNCAMNISIDEVIMTIKS